MRFEFTTSGKFSDTLKWLDDVKDKVPTKTMQAIGKEGVSKLAAGTPKGETGETAAGWGYTVEKTSNGAELSFHNDAHPETAVNVAMLIQYGHGTGTGGYVPPTDYINPALKALFDSAGDRIAKEMFE